MEPLTIRRGDIFMVNLDPVVGSEQGGIRPVLNIQNNTGNRFSPTVIVAAITTRHKGTQPTHVDLGSKYGLPEDSVLSAEQPRTLDKSRLLSYVGHVDTRTMNEVNRALKVSLDLLQNEPCQKTLCKSCASKVFHSGLCVIQRIDRYQTSRSRCEQCHSKPGFDYLLSFREKKSTGQGRYEP